MPDEATKIIREANDRFRAGDTTIPGQWVITQGMAATIEEAGRTPLAVVEIVQAFDTFAKENDPYGTHEFGSFLFEGETCFWKIDLYDSDLQFGSPDPADLSKTHRVLTIILAREY